MDRYTSAKEIYASLGVDVEAALAKMNEATAKKMEEFRLVVWGMHGIYGAGKTMDETFGLIETVEKVVPLVALRRVRNSILASLFSKIFRRYCIFRKNVLKL